MKKWLRIISGAITLIKFIIKKQKSVNRSQRHIRPSDLAGIQEQRSGADQEISGDAKMDDHRIGPADITEGLNMANSYLNRASLPRGIRNNNPGNIRKGNTWRGLVVPGADNSFDQFENIAYGIRALYYTLYTYMTKHNLLSIREIISRWAPPIENKTENYILYVSTKLNRPADSKTGWSKSQFKELTRAIIDMEVGSHISRQYIKDSDLNEGFSLLPKKIQDYYSGSITPKGPAMAGINPILLIAAIGLLFSKVKI